MLRIFLAHASEDKAAVTRLYRQLKAKGYQPWLDTEDLLGGQAWASEIRKVIKASDVVIACLSKHSVSKDGYVQKEFKMALNVYAEKPSGSIYLIPLRLDDSPLPDLRNEDYGTDFRKIHWIDFFESDGFERLVRSLEAKLPVSDGSQSTPLQELEMAPEPIAEALTEEVATASGKSSSTSSVQLLSTFPYYVVRVNSAGRELSRQQQSAQYVQEDLGNGVTLDLVLLPGDRFCMGSPKTELERLDREGPQHKVDVASFYLGRYPVTQRQWRAVSLLDDVDIALNPAPSRFEGDNRPVEQVSWYEAVEFCQRLSRHTSREYRLPSEAEWEYACRVGKTTPFHFGETLTSELANYRATYTYGDGPKGEYREQTTDVGSFSANAFGLHDMHGNVWEWCEDHWHDNYEGAPVDGSAWIEGRNAALRVLRGGSWYSDPEYCRSASRSFDIPDNRYFSIGFRVSCAAPRTLA